MCVCGQREPVFVHSDRCCDSERSRFESWSLSLEGIRVLLCLAFKGPCSTLCSYSLNRLCIETRDRCHSEESAVSLNQRGERKTIMGFKEQHVYKPLVPETSANGRVMQSRLAWPLHSPAPFVPDKDKIPCRNAFPLPHPSAPSLRPQPYQTLSEASFFRFFITGEKQPVDHFSLNVRQAG